MLAIASGGMIYGEPLPSGSGGYHIMQDANHEKGERSVERSHRKVFLAETKKKDQRVADNMVGNIFILKRMSYAILPILS